MTRPERQPASNRQVYLDLDGVCVDFDMAVACLVEPLAPGTVAKVDAGHEDVFEASGLSHGKVWDLIDDHGTDFWFHLPAFPWCEELYTKLSEVAQVAYSTSTSLSPHSAAGKLRWMQARHGRAFRDYQLGPLKDHMAAPGRVLVDDLPRNLEAYNKAARALGATNDHTVLFPPRKEAFALHAQGQLVSVIVNCVRIRLDNP